MNSPCMKLSNDIIGNYGRAKSKYEGSVEHIQERIGEIIRSSFEVEL